MVLPIGLTITIKHITFRERIGNKVNEESCCEIPLFSSYYRVKSLLL